MSDGIVALASEGAGSGGGVGQGKWATAARWRIRRTRLLAEAGGSVYSKPASGRPTLARGQARDPTIPEVEGPTYRFL